MQDISKHQQLISLGLDLCTLGRQVEDARAQVAALAEQGCAGSCGAAMNPDKRPEGGLFPPWPHVQAYTARLRRLRIQTGTSQAKLAAALGTSQTMYARYERGANELPLHHLVALSRYFGVTTDFLPGLEGSPDA